MSRVFICSFVGVEKYTVYLISPLTPQIFQKKSTNRPQAFNEKQKLSEHELAEKKRVDAILKCLRDCIFEKNSIAVFYKRALDGNKIGVDKV